MLRVADRPSLDDFSSSLPRRDRRFSLVSPLAVVPCVLFGLFLIIVIIIIILLDPVFLRSARGDKTFGLPLGVAAARVRTLDVMRISEWRLARECVSFGYTGCLGFTSACVELSFLRRETERGIHLVVLMEFGKFWKLDYCLSESFSTVISVAYVFYVYTTLITHVIGIVTSLVIQYVQLVVCIYKIYTSV